MDEPRTTNDEIPKARIETFTVLRDSAQTRFQSRRDVEWKVGFALWSTSGVAAGLIITARSWTPHWQEIVAGTIISSITIFLYAYYWLPYLTETGQRELRQGYFWDTHIQKALGIPLPAHLRPRQRPNSDTQWASAYDADPNCIDGKIDGEPRTIAKKWHEAVWLQLAVTTLMCALFVGALWSKAIRKPTTPDASRVTIEGSSIEIDNMSKVKLTK